MLGNYEDYMMNAPMTDDKEISAFFDEIREEEEKKKAEKEEDS